MTWDRELEELMVDTIQVSTAVTARDLYGTETWSTPRTIAARVVRSHGARRNDRGESHPDESLVWFHSTFLLSSGALVTIDGHTQPVSRTSVYKDETGLYHHKLFVGWTHRGN